MAEITWIKLKTDMFSSTKIKLIEKLPEGDTILIIWIKLLTAAGKANSNGYIMLTENIPMNVEEMSIVFDRPLNTIRLAIEAFKRYGMIEVDENEIVRIANWEKHQNIDGMEKVRLQNAERNRKYRERKKQETLPPPNNSHDVGVTSRDGIEEEVEVDKELDIDKEREKEAPPSVIDDSFLKIKKYYEEHVVFQQSTFREAQQLGEMLDDYLNVELIIEAMKISVQRGKPSIPYINGILKAWRTDNITNVQQLNKTKEVPNGSNRQQSNVSKADADERLRQESERLKKFLQ